MPLLAGRFEIGAALRETPLTLVYAARDSVFERDVTITVLRPGLADQPGMLRLFSASTAAAAELSHPGIARIYDVGTDEWPNEASQAESPNEASQAESPNEASAASQANRANAPIGGTVSWVAGEYFDAPRADRYEPPQGIGRDRWADQLMSIADQLVDAMQEAHADGIVHGNLGPSSVHLLDTDGGLRVKITGFGPQTADLAVLSDPELTARMWAGFTRSLEYPSPEQTRGRAPTRRSDIYGFGCILTALLPPASEHAETDPTDPDAHAASLPGVHVDLTDEVRLLAAHAMRPVPDARPRSFHAVREQLNWIRVARQLETNSAAHETAPVTTRLPGSPGAGLPAAVGSPETGDIPDTVATTVPPFTSGMPALTGARGVTGSARAASVAEPPTETERISLSPHRPRTGTTAIAPRGRRLSPAGKLFLMLAAVAALAGLGSYWITGPGRSEAAASTITVPAVAGRSIAAATTTLTDAGLMIGGQRAQASPTIKAGLVVGTDPGAGAALDPQTPITLLVSKGPDLVAVPQLRGMTLTDGQNALRAAGLAAGGVTQQDGVDKAGVVLGSRPDYGAKVAHGSSIALTVASGEQSVPTGLVGQAKQAVIDALTAAGFAPQVYTVDSSKYQSDLVASLSPAAGARLPLGSIVSITVTRFVPDSSRNPDGDGSSDGAPNTGAGQVTGNDATDTPPSSTTTPTPDPSTPTPNRNTP